MQEQTDRMRADVSPLGVSKYDNVPWNREKCDGKPKVGLEVSEMLTDFCSEMLSVRIEQTHDTSERLQRWMPVWERQLAGNDRLRGSFA